MSRTKKGQQKGMSNILINEEIKTKKVLMVTDDGLKEMSIEEALEKAYENNLDLVQVSQKDSLPVCKLTDAAKLAYEKKKKEKEMRKNSMKNRVVIKEVQLGVGTQQHDIETKLNNVRKWLYKEKCKVRITLKLRGREKIRTEMATKKLNAILEELKDVAVCEKGIEYRDSQAFMIIEPIK